MGQKFSAAVHLVELQTQTTKIFFMSQVFGLIDTYCTPFYGPRSRGGNMFGSIRLSVCSSVDTLTFEPFDL